MRVGGRITVGGPIRRFGTSATEPNGAGNHGRNAVYTQTILIYTRAVAKHLIDIDEQALEQARVELGTSTIKDTVNDALRAATAQRKQRVTSALNTLGAAPHDNRDDAWR